MTLQLTGNDLHGSPFMSVANGSCSTFGWSPFGATAQRSGLSASLPGFNGERADPLSGVTHLGNGYRAYSPVLRRFTCPDSSSPFGEGGVNPYAYCEGDPINHTDPSGHGIITLIIRAIALAIRIGLKVAMSEGTAAMVSTAGYVETGVTAAASLATGVSARVVKTKNPEAARKLQWAGIGLGIAAAAGAAEAVGTRIMRCRKGVSQVAQRVDGVSYNPRGSIAEIFGETAEAVGETVEAQNEALTAVAGPSRVARTTLIGYHGTNAEGAAGLMGEGPKGHSFFATNTWENANHYAGAATAGRGGQRQILRVVTSDLELVKGNAAFRPSNAANIAEVRIGPGAFKSLSFEYANTPTDVTVAFEDMFHTQTDVMQAAQRQFLSKYGLQTASRSSSSASSASGSAIDEAESAAYMSRARRAGRR
ncbi:RHS repeat-associated core domain-containing protein [Trabulsiella odontotermitis]|uniref:RHS repeat-associated core domain-containing protein n=1 Tax=Trabulsiella odontotermitis TaxID=379893 RepID=UPI0006764EE2|nr:RHS repeat-associated core domain-containing protein [Trabulsiella odontotermitis]